MSVSFPHSCLLSCGMLLCFGLRVPSFIPSFSNIPIPNTSMHIRSPLTSTSAACLSPTETLICVSEASTCAKSRRRKEQTLWHRRPGRPDSPATLFMSLPHSCKQRPTVTGYVSWWPGQNITSHSSHECKLIYRHIDALWPKILRVPRQYTHSTGVSRDAP